eukprot:3417572-Alexandrium_andersonii.AAC.1
MHVTEKAKAAFEQHNKDVAEGRRSKKTKPWTWGHLKDGFYGTQCLDIGRHETLKQEDVVRLWGYSMYATMASGAQKAKKARAG